MKCFNCKQEMPNVNLFNITVLREAIRDHSDIDWEELVIGDVLNIVSLPIGWSATVIDAATEYNYDSYGDSTSSGHVVFELTDGSTTKNFKIEGYSSSYDGWTWHENYITEVSASPKLVTIWEAI